ncbi:MAG TPA: type II toxin-antitoxin system RelE/ParE family toxin [Bryobacteraceae bacterium]|nr:type II toxin-antitoxin system RelE/ParE family toxin [Bryobacteraceae bacterium]
MATKSWKVEVSKSAVKSLRSINEPFKGKILKAIAQLAEDPLPFGNKRLVDVEPPMYRIRVGDYRIVYEVFTDEALVRVARIRHRSDVYKDL